MQLYRDFRIGIALRAQLHNAAGAVVFLLQQFTDPLPLQACVGMLGQSILGQVVFQQSNGDIRAYFAPDEPAPTPTPEPTATPEPEEKETLANTAE